MNQVQTIFGWAGSDDIFEVLRQEFSENDCKILYNTLFFKIETQNKNSTKPDKSIRPNRGINNWIVDKYIEERKTKEKTIISYLYGINYSAYDKIYRLRKFIDLINCKYCTGIKLNFCYSHKGYTFLMYFDEPSKNNIDMQKLNGYISQWGRMKDKFKLEPKVYSIDSTFYIKPNKPNVPWPVNDKFAKQNNDPNKFKMVPGGSIGIIPQLNSSMQAWELEDDLADDDIVDDLNCVPMPHPVSISLMSDGIIKKEIPKKPVLPNPVIPKKAVMSKPPIPKKPSKFKMGDDYEDGDFLKAIEESIKLMKQQETKQEKKDDIDNIKEKSKDDEIIEDDELIQDDEIIQDNDEIDQTEDSIYVSNEIIE